MTGFEKELYRVGASVANQAAAAQKEELANMSERKFKRGLPVEPMQPGDMADLIEIALSTVSRTGAPAHYEDDEQGLQEFWSTSKEYFQAIVEQNRAAGEPTQMLIPSIEMWCSFLGIARTTLFNYQRRSDEWKNCINFFKTVIYAAKNELASHGKISPVLLIFDSVNNFDYRNVAEFKLEPVQEKDNNLPNIDQVMKKIARNEARAQIEDKHTEEQNQITAALDEYL